MNFIEIEGVRKNNLKNLKIKIPQYKITAVTGRSGSGKSSLVIDVIHKESQKQYLEILSLNETGSVEQIIENSVDEIKNISPSIAIDQNYSKINENMTVSEISGIDQYLRLLLINYFTLNCYNCGNEVNIFSTSQIKDKILKEFTEKKISIYSPLKFKSKDNIKQQFKKYQKKGYIKAKSDNKIIYLDEKIKIDFKHSTVINLLIDVIKVDKSKSIQLEESIRLAIDEGKGEIMIESEGETNLYSSNLFCHNCKIDYQEPVDETFNFKLKNFQCTVCQGVGEFNKNFCSECLGSGLNKTTLSFYFNNVNYSELLNMNIKQLNSFFNKISCKKYNTEEIELLKMIIKKIQKRIETFQKLSLDYLSLNRRVKTLSGGELQRSRIVGQLNGGLCEIVYILDEPSIGMHPLEQKNLMQILKDLKKKNNTIIIVEHEKRMINCSDYIIELGPGAGKNGGYIVYNGSIKQYKKIQLNKCNKIKKQILNKKQFIKIDDLNLRNIKNLNLKILRNSLNVISGVSGSGKTTLVKDLLYPKINELLDNKEKHSNIKSRCKISGANGIKKIMIVDQKAAVTKNDTIIASYTKVFPYIRKIFAMLLDSRKMGYKASHFNYDNQDGRCDCCKGKGYLKESDEFFVFNRINCYECKGKKYNQEILSIKYKQKTISDILQFSIFEAFEVYKKVPSIGKKLKIMIDFGLGYLHLGQAVKSLSGGELQKLKLCKELQKENIDEKILIFDEPTIGLHDKDVLKLINIFKLLIKRKNTLVVIEHNSDIILNADYIIELGPAGGPKGGKIIFDGIVKDLVELKSTSTANFLKEEIYGI